jgi:uncharacterized protein (TIGR03083 family)
MSFKTDAGMDVDRYLLQLQLNGEQLARAAEYAGLAAPVTSCPGWTVAAAVGHVAKVHEWASWLIRGGAPDRFSYRRPEPDRLLDAYRAGVAELAATLARATDTQPMHTLWPARSPRLFWARRQAHETAIHRVDLQLAAGYGVSDTDPDFAADGIDELVMGMIPDRLAAATADPPVRVLLEPLDANMSWTVQVGPDGVRVARQVSDGADLSVFGLSAELYRWVWNRAADDEVTLRGALPVADWWRQTVRIGARG